jgi:hypothetical protein
MARIRRGKRKRNARGTKEKTADFEQEDEAKQRSTVALKIMKML